IPMFYHDWDGRHRLSKATAFSPYTHFSQSSRLQRRKDAITSRQTSSSPDNIHLLASSNEPTLLSSVLTHQLVVEGKKPATVLLAVDSKRRTMLHFACAQGSVQVVSLLLRFRDQYFGPNKRPVGSNSDDEEDDDDGDEDNTLPANRMLAMRDINGSSPLHLAVVGNHLSIVSMLLQAGADLTGCDGSGRTPVDLVKSRLRILSTRYGGIGQGNAAQVPYDLHKPLIAELNDMMDILSVCHKRAPPSSSNPFNSTNEIESLEAKFKLLSNKDNTERPVRTDEYIEEVVDEIGSLLSSLHFQQECKCK
ncbi:UNVERIFIED_CONTAM: hypothetical protein HDU68_003605, partial [Siphonaria sp. JEL0065]